MGIYGSSYKENENKPPANFWDVPKKDKKKVSGRVVYNVKNYYYAKPKMAISKKSVGFKLNRKKFEGLVKSIKL